MNHFADPSVRGKPRALPTVEEAAAAYRLTDRHFALTYLREVLYPHHPWPPLSREERAFLADCAAGALDRAHEVQRLFRLAKSSRTAGSA
ncbi:MAG TPA: hypothetical protein VGD08_21480 [Stellaceae bacterium]|jgi:hypothetical protein